MMLIIAHLKYTEPGWQWFLKLRSFEIAGFSFYSWYKKHNWKPIGRLVTCRSYESRALIFRQWSHLPVRNNKRERNIMTAQE